MAATDDQTERDTQRDGRWLLFGGSTLIALDVIAATWCRIETGHASPYEIFITIMAAGVIALVVGLRERNSRTGRAAMQRILAEQSAIAAAVADIPTILVRLEAVEDVVVKLPGYPEGVLEGVELAKRVRTSDG